jgi:hypothetical protein
MLEDGIPALFGSSVNVSKAMISPKIADEFSNDPLNKLLIKLDEEVPHDLFKFGNLIMATIYPMTLDEKNNYKFAAWRQDVEVNDEIHRVLAVVFAEEVRERLQEECN